MARNNRTISIRSLIIGAFLFVVLIGSLTIGVIVFTNWYRLANRNANLLATQITDQITNEVNEFLTNPEHVNEYNKLIIENELFDVDSFSTQEAFFVDILKYHDHQIFSTVFATPEGHMYGARYDVSNDSYRMIKVNDETNGNLENYYVNEDGSIGELAYTILDFDPRTLSWYIDAISNEKTVYVPMHQHQSGEFTFTVSTPVYNTSNVLLGVLSSSVTFDQLNQFLYQIMSDVEGTTVIFDLNTKYLIANSMQAQNFTISGDDIEHHLYRDIVSLNQIEAYEQFLETNEIQFKYDGTGEAIFVNATTYENDDIGWVVFTAIPQSFFMEHVYRSLNYTIGIIIIILFLGTFFYLKIAKILFKSLEDLAVTANQFSHGDFNVRAVKYRNDEVGKLTDAFNHMAGHLSHLVNNLEEIVDQRTEALKEASETILQGQQQLKSILDSTAEGIYGIDIDGNCTFINQSAVKLLGFDNDLEFIGKDMHQLIHYKHKNGDLYDCKECPILNTIRQKEPIYSARSVFYKKDGSKLKVRYSAYPQLYQGQLQGAVVSFIDNTKEQEREEQMEYISYHDYLTGLYNRRYFVEELARKDTKEFYPLGIIMLDLNALKLFNDAFGHFTGDQALVELSRVLEDFVRDDGVVCRQGGDEFSVILPHTSEVELNSLKHTIKDKVSEIRIEKVQLSVAVGYECKYDEKTKLDDILKNAENHMYKNKMSERLNVNNNAILAILNTLFDKHPHERKHAEEVSHYAKLIGKALKLKSNDIHDLSIAGLYHDIGKISISDQILDKPGALTDDEYTEIQKHAEIGYQILKAADEYSEYAVHAYSHHENFDGSGYPRGLKGKDIPLFSRIISVSNAYQNMTTDQPYRKAMTENDAIEELKKYSQTQFDPEIVDIFIKKVLKK
jgi:diguanylate cyclase (GGDEF)-like protein/PAS domain S-box-containing protein